jgi:hypothetical protein
MPEVPQPFVGRDQALLGTAIDVRGEVVGPHCDQVQNDNQVPCGIEVALVAGVVERRHDLVRQAPFPAGTCLAWGGGGRFRQLDCFDVNRRQSQIDRHVLASGAACWGDGRTYGFHAAVCGGVDLDQSAIINCKNGDIPHASGID